MGMGQGASAGSGGGGSGQRADFNHNWQFTSSVNPEELFRKIFGDAGYRNADFTDFQEDYADSKYGFGAAQEVRIFFVIYLIFYFGN